MAVQACTNVTHLKLIFTLLFDATILSSDCEILLVHSDGSTLHFIDEPNDCLIFTISDINHAERITARCPVCGSEIDIYHTTSDDVLVNTSNCPLGENSNL